jgi:hypothetical protein
MARESEAFAKNRSRRSWIGAAGVLIVVGVSRIASTYSVFSPTGDEPVHIACGVAWLTGKGGYESQHPPLARLAAATLLCLSGGPSTRASDAKALHLENASPLLLQGRALLYDGGRPGRNLALSRVGILPFFALASVLVWSWARRLFGDGVAVAALALFTSLPPVLAHGGLATTDMAITATLFGAVYAFACWLRAPTSKRSVVLGAVIGLALLSKFSSLLFFPAVVAALTVSFWLARKRTRESPRGPILPQLSSVATVTAVGFFVVWAGYRFQLAPARPREGRPHTTIVRSLHLERYFARHPRLRETVFTMMEAPIPAGNLVDGLAAIGMHAQEGHFSFLLGNYRDHGWWYFFPVVLAVKTPVAFLLLVLVGSFLLSRRRKELDWEAWAPAASALVILAAVLPSGINIGVRHVLPIYPFLSILAGYGAARLLTAPRRPIQFMAGLALVAWHVGSSLAAHPDYLPYFNELAFSRPERISLDSDLDWGQDTKRLGIRLRQLGVDRVTVGGLDTEYLQKVGGIQASPLKPYEPMPGWIAIGEFFLRVKGERIRREMGRADSPFAWLEAQPSYERVGKSIRLYRLDP